MSRIAARSAAFLLATTAALLLATAPASAATPRIVGGQPIDAASSAPFTVLILSFSGSGQARCTGTIIDATHVLTAAHCARNAQNQPWPLGSSFILIGTSTMEGSDGLVGVVRGARVHPAYDPATGQADVAVLTVPRIPLSNTIAAIPLIDVGAAPAPGTPVRAFGWGNTTNDQWDGVERMLDLTVGVPTDCWSGIAAVGCASVPTGGPCPGDSGGPVVRDGIQVGVTDIRIGADCVPGSQLGFADLSAPGIGLFVRGEDNPPPLPFTAGVPTLAPPALTGGAATCTTPAWTNAAATTTVFFHRDGGAVVQTGPATTYAPTAADAGHDLSCRSVATAAGGSATATAATVVKILPVQLAVRAGAKSAAVSYNGAPGLGITVTLRNAKGRTAWTKSLGSAREVRMPTVRPGVYRLCADAPAAGQFPAAQACQRWRAPTPAPRRTTAKRRG